MSKVKAKIVLNSGFTRGNTVAAFPFYVVKNKHGRFVCNWTPGPELQPEGFSDVGKAKAAQMAALRSDWLTDEAKRLDVIQVVDGKSGSAKAKIQSFCESILPGSRVMFVLPTNKDDHKFLDGLKMRPPSADKVTTMQMEGLTCDPESPFKIVDIHGRN